MTTISKTEARLLLADANARADALSSVPGEGNKAAAAEITRFAGRLATLVAGAAVAPVTKEEIARFHDVYDAEWDDSAAKQGNSSADDAALIAAINALLVARAASHPMPALDAITGLPAQWRVEAGEAESRAARVAILNCAYQLEHRLAAIGERG